MDTREIVAKFKEHGVPISENDAWKVQQATVIKHKALERLAAALRISWSKPEVLRAERDECVLLVSGSLPNTDAFEWSIGECLVVPMKDSGRKNKWGKPEYEVPEGAIGNYQITPKQGAYPYAMAEKRAKDRLIIKLAGLHGAYSEEEADDFSGRDQNQPDEPKRLSAPETKNHQADETVQSDSQNAPEAPPPSSEQDDATPARAKKADTRTPEEKAEAIKQKLRECPTPADVPKLMGNKAVIAVLEALGEDLAKEIKAVGMQRQAELKAARIAAEAAAKKAAAEAAAANEDNAGGSEAQAA